MGTYLGIKGVKRMKDPKGVFVGTFSEQDLEDGKDKKAVELKKKETGLKYTNTRLTKDGLKIWVCNVDDFEL